MLIKIQLVKRILYSVLAVIILLPFTLYIRHAVYLPAHVSPFAGSKWYNPYEGILDAPLLKANFHAHTRSWGGVTFGADTDEEMIGAYATRGYHVPALSNYHRVTPADAYADTLVYVPLYEHGYNVHKVHCLCLGATSVSLLDLPLHFTRHHTQSMIQNLQHRCSLIAFAHPGRRSAHEPADIAALSGFQLMEVIFPRGVATDYWDSVLSAGRPVWILSNDDTHDMQNQKTFVRWNMIYSTPGTPDGVLHALKNGNHYGVMSYDQQCEDNRLTRFEILHDTLFVALRDTFNRIDLYGQNGKTLHVHSRDHAVAYAITPADTYIRAEVHHDHCVMYLNPVIRYEGNTPPHLTDQELSVDQKRTWLMRLIVFCAMIAVVLLWYRMLQRTGRHHTSKMS